MRMQPQRDGRLLCFLVPWSTTGRQSLDVRCTSGEAARHCAPRLGQLYTAAGSYLFRSTHITSLNKLRTTHHSNHHHNHCSHHRNPCAIHPVDAWPLTIPSAVVAAVPWTAPANGGDRAFAGRSPLARGGSLHHHHPPQTAKRSPFSVFCMLRPMRAVFISLGQLLAAQDDGTISSTASSGWASYYDFFGALASRMRNACKPANDAKEIRRKNARKSTGVHGEWN